MLTLGSPPHGKKPHSISLLENMPHGMVAGRNWEKFPTQLLTHVSSPHGMVSDGYVKSGHQVVPSEKNRRQVVAGRIDMGRVAGPAGSVTSIAE